jgi:hypothetical protein
MARVTPKITPRTRKRTARKALGKARLEALVEEAIIDAYGESEQRVGLLTMLEETLAVPFTMDILGVPVRVERVGSQRCRRDRGDLSPRPTAAADPYRRSSATLTGTRRLGVD